MGKDSILQGLASAGKTTLQGAKSISKVSYEAGKNHYANSKAARGGRSSNSSSRENSRHETSVKLENLPDPNKLPPPPVRRDQQQGSPESSIRVGSASSSTVQTHHQAQLSKIPDSQYSRGRDDSTNSNAPFKRVSYKGDEIILQPLGPRPPHKAEYNQTPQLPDFQQAPVHQKERNADTQHSNNSKVTSKPAPPIPVRNYDASVISGLSSSHSGYQPSLPNRNNDSQSPVNLQSHTKVKTLEQTNLMAQKGSPRAVPEIDVTSLPPPPSHRDLRRAVTSSSETSNSAIEITETDSLPDNPAVIRPSMLEKSTAWSKNNKSDNIASSSSTVNQSFNYNHIKKLDIHPTPPPRPFTTSSVGNTEDSQELLKTPNSKPTTHTPSTGLNTPTVHQYPLLEIKKTVPSVLGRYENEQTVNFPPPPKPPRKADYSSGLSATAKDSSALSHTGHEKEIIVRRSETQSSLPIDPPPVYTASIPETKHALQEINDRSKFPSEVVQPRGQYLGTRLHRQSNPKATDDTELQLANDISEIKLRHVDAKVLTTAENTKIDKKPPPIVPKKKETLASIKKIPPPVPKKKSSLVSKPIVPNHVSQSPDLEDSGITADAGLSNSDDNPFRRYLKNVVPEESNRVNRR
ncbi:Aim3p Ecym_3468 [Eremothecium cymbalariae DBVPG|uniref:Altered inheritance of mitochondria protein 3 n=1 Tax=Eremothecium cymbalariae (strain CBS 270.75 / DBVPG 7215 / KCTC 17166 / NRRL Y-17582) TaxID=931890 RepID=G8JS32_ERECY|nr:Hypothetical protein Ecym_3468 [Eremothecium cymbalariae DBVPG\